LIDFDPEQILHVVLRLYQILKLQLPTSAEKSYINPLVVEHFLTEISIKETEKLSHFSPPSIPHTHPTSQSYKTSNMVAPIDHMGAIIAARYTPLVLPHPLHEFPTNDYMKYLPKFNGEGEKTVEEHITDLYGFANNFGIEQQDVWMRLFAQSLEGEVQKWFRALQANSIPNILAFDVLFLMKWGDRKDDLYYITEFTNLRRKPGESILDFT